MKSGLRTESGLRAEPGVQHGSNKELNVLAESRLFVFQGEPFSDTSGWPCFKEEAAVLARDSEQREANVSPSSGLMGNLAGSINKGIFPPLSFFDVKCQVTVG